MRKIHLPPEGGLWYCPKRSHSGGTLTLCASGRGRKGAELSILREATCLSCLKRHNDRAQYHAGQAALRLKEVQTGQERFDGFTYRKRLSF